MAEESIDKTRNRLLGELGSLRLKYDDLEMLLYECHSTANAWFSRTETGLVGVDVFNAMKAHIEASVALQARLKALDAELVRVSKLYDKLFKALDKK